MEAGLQNFLLYFLKSISERFWSLFIKVLQLSARHQCVHQWFHLQLCGKGVEKRRKVLPAGEIKMPFGEMPNIERRDQVWGRLRSGYQGFAETAEERREKEKERENEEK